MSQPSCRLVEDPIRVALPRSGPFGIMLTIAPGSIGALAATYLGQEAGWYRVEESGGLIAAALGNCRALGLELSVQESAPNLADVTSTGCRNRFLLRLTSAWLAGKLTVRALW